MTKTLKKGFTIVELLIVIVVIGILAAIVLVTYQGVQNKANTTSAEQNARELVGKATAFNAVATVFPTLEELKTAKSGSVDIKEAKLGEKVLGLLGSDNAVPAGTSSATKQKLAYAPCSAGTASNKTRVGAIAVYWNYSDNKLAYVKAGETTGTDCATPMSTMDDGATSVTLPAVAP